MKNLFKYSQQIILLIILVLVSGGVVFAKGFDLTVLTSGFLRAANHYSSGHTDCIPCGDTFFHYGYGWSGNLQEWGYGYGYSSNIGRSVEESDLPGLAEYGFDGEDGVVTIDSVTVSKTTATITYSTNYLARFAYGIGTGYPVTEDNVVANHDNNRDYFSGVQTINATGLTCGTTYYYVINARDAGDNRWGFQDSFTTASCNTNHETVTGSISAPTNTQQSTSHNPRGLRLPPITLALGSLGTDVQDLQILLNFFGTFLASDGAGSPGTETQTFGTRTKAALMKFQSTFGLEKVDGIYGQKTHDVMESFLK